MSDRYQVVGMIGNTNKVKNFCFDADDLMEVSKNIAENLHTNIDPATIEQDFPTGQEAFEYLIETNGQDADWIVLVKDLTTEEVLFKQSRKRTTGYYYAYY